MKLQPITPDLVPKLVQAFGQHPLLRLCDARTLSDLATQSVLAHFMDNEPIYAQGDRADAWLIVLRGTAAVRVTPEGMTDAFDVDRAKPVDMVGDFDALMGIPRRLSVIALEQVLALQAPVAMLHELFQRSAAFGLAYAQQVGAKFLQEARRVPLPYYDVAKSPMTSEVVNLLPPQFIDRQRVIPVASQGNRLLLGCVDELTAHVMSSARDYLPGVELIPVRIDGAAFNYAMQNLVSFESKTEEPATGQGGAKASGVMPSAPASTKKYVAPKLDPLLKRMVAEGASDLHLSGNHRPRWRIDGEMREIADAKVLTETQVYEIIESGMPERNRKQFLEENDSDFAYAVPDVARFRCNVFRDHNGIGSVMRVIPSKILTLEQLGLPEGVRRMCDNPKGLVLVTGPTGSGKSTTLAAMIDYINRNRRSHIITLEDPIEFVHKSQRSLVNQREVGPHTQSFGRALRAALREDPDIVLVGEMRDKETIALALETANTGHLVFGTLHTSTAISTVDRIIDVFPPEQQAQIRTVVAEVIKGVVSQTLLRRKGGGRIAALEVLIGSHAVSNLIREGKNHQIFNIMLTAKNQGNQMLNDQLEALVRDGKAEYDEALMKALDKPELAKRFGKEYFEK
ncbi:MAG: PilT/PilU family type 4a pilus ATPase [Deltaproteobacteria bacterium]|nr:PilT/PilU family type 4a pilus ATPase [Deltaproteobacteria bacterium]